VCYTYQVLFCCFVLMIRVILIWKKTALRECNISDENQCIYPILHATYLCKSHYQPSQVPLAGTQSHRRCARRLVIQGHHRSDSPGPPGSRMSLLLESRFVGVCWQCFVVNMWVPESYGCHFIAGDGQLQIYCFSTDTYIASTILLFTARHFDSKFSLHVLGNSNIRYI
jgi:hypothetical protein